MPYIIVYKSLLIEKNTWNHITVCTNYLNQIGNVDIVSVLANNWL